jgi:TPR repeat protein
MKRFVVLTALLAMVAPAQADVDDDGSLNPEEMTLRSFVERARAGEADPVICMQGYMAVKSGRHDWGNDIFEACAEQGYTSVYHWRSYMAHNGLGRPEDPAEAAEWDKKAADAGDPIGQFNYGLDLLRGHGVPTDPIRGRQFIDRAASAGLDVAVELQEAAYDPAAVTPDADEWKYEKPLF